MSNGEEIRDYFRQAVRLLMKVHALYRRPPRDPYFSAPPAPTRLDETHDEIGRFLQELKTLNEHFQAGTPPPAVRGSPDCKHHDAKQERRISGNGYTFVWRCQDCRAYLNPNWSETRPG